MLKALVIGAGKDVYETEDRDKIKEVYRQGNKLLWIDVFKPQGDDLEFLAEALAFHPLCIKDCNEYNKNPKIDEYDDYLFIITHVLTGGEELAFPQLDLFLSLRYLVTVHHAPMSELEQYWRRLLLKLYDGPVGLDLLVYNVFDSVSAGYWQEIERISSSIEEIEDRVIENDTEEILPEITRLRRSLIYMRRQLSAEIAMLEKLTHPDIEFFNDTSRAYLKDSMERFERIFHVVEVNRELIAGLFDTHLSVMSHRLNGIFASQNKVMQRLTVITAVFMPLSLLAGIYGMNFRYMPELNWPFGYFLVLLIMLSLGAGLYLYFKRMGWLD